MAELDCRLEAVKAVPGVAVVTLRGAIDPKNVATLASTLSTARGQGFRTLVLDLGEIRYVNSAGLAYLVNLSDQLAARGGSLCLANPQPKVKVVFDLMGVTQFFRLYKSVHAALGVIMGNRRVSDARSPSRSRLR